MQKIKKIFSILILIILISILVFSSVILINSYKYPDKVPSFFGWKPFIVLSGSMESEISVGDIVVVKEVDTSKLKKGDIIAFKQNEVVITHRIDEIKNEDGITKYITKGDNNNTQDKGYVLPEQIEGVFQYKVSRLGNLAMFIQTPTGMVVTLSIPILLLILIQFSESRKNKKITNENIDKQKQMEEEIEKLKIQNQELMKK